MSIDVMPIWVLFAVTLLALTLAIELGYQTGRASNRRSADEKESPVAAMVGAVLGLTAFMLAFVFGIVAERYDAKKALVREDAIAIRAAWQRADLLPTVDRAAAKAQLREYLDARITFAQARDLDPQGMERVLQQARALQERLWTTAMDNALGEMNSDYASLFIESLNEMEAVHAARIAVAIQARVPTEIWFAVYSMALLGMMGLGYQTGLAGSNRSLARPFLVLSFALAFALIAELDRPDSGVLAVNQQPLIDLRDTMGPP